MTENARNRLEGKVAIVTGAGMDMGAATAKVFAGYGAKVIVSDINARAGEGTVAAIVAAGSADPLPATCGTVKAISKQNL